MEIKKLSNGNFEITREYLEELLESNFKLNALINGGVDDWEFYDDAMEDFDFDDVIDFIESIE
jgi:hypothetical protein|nr:MAG TPA: hypothetical protein [Caudoviricetes sp.]